MVENAKEIINSNEFKIILSRLTHQLIENHNDFIKSALVGIQPRGIFLAKRIQKELETKVNSKIIAGAIDPTFYRDDFRKKDYPLLPSVTNIDFSIEGKKIILIDDVLYTGRTVRAAMDALLAYGRPKSIELLVLVDRRFNRNLPIQADYIGKFIDTISSENVQVNWSEFEKFEKVILRKNE